MDIFVSFYDWIDAFLIAPFRWPGNEYLGFFLGVILLNFYTISIGELTGAVLFLLHHRYFSSMQDNMVRYHNLSVDALHSGNKEAYIAANKMAHEDFGKSFFGQATIGFATLWPLPFALGWMSKRFEDVVLWNLPWPKISIRYPFVVIGLYIVMRILLSKRKKHFALFRRVEAIKQEARERRGRFKSFFNPPPPEETAVQEGKKDNEESKDSEESKGNKGSAD
ncbi:hypothetical protein LJC59_03480 [Desulfovibrio sp. OttesenSCG-928-A18]|nr:hypothetical protein [Desulfovibrio sp. OttesenSCG-928-A18]